jgi:hypothetical protein
MWEAGKDSDHPLALKLFRSRLQLHRILLHQQCFQVEQQTQSPD